MINTRVAGFPACVFERKSKTWPKELMANWAPMEWGLPRPENTEGFSARANFKAWKDAEFIQNRVSTTEGWNILMRNKSLEAEAMKVLEGIIKTSGMHLEPDNDDYLCVTSPNFVGWATCNRSCGYLYINIFTRQTALQEASNG